MMSLALGMNASGGAIGVPDLLHPCHGPCSNDVMVTCAVDPVKIL
jgi:hypothetical protein